MRVCDVVIGEFLEMRDPSSRYGYLKAVGIVLANQDHSVDWRYVGQDKLPYITVLCEHTAFYKDEGMIIIRRIRPRDLVKEN